MEKSIDETIYQHIQKITDCMNEAKAKQFEIIQAKAFITKSEHLMFRDFLYAIDEVSKMSHDLYIKVLKESLFTETDEP